MPFDRLKNVMDLLIVRCETGEQIILTRQEQGQDTTDHEQLLGELLEDYKYLSWLYQVASRSQDPDKFLKKLANLTGQVIPS